MTTKEIPYDGTCIKASELDKNERYFKLTNKDEKHFGMQYATGLNVDVLSFNPSGECNSGGLYFFSESQLINYKMFINFDPHWIREVTFEDLDDEPIYVEKNKYKTHRFILGEKHRINTRGDMLTYVRFDDNYIANKTIKNATTHCHLGYIPKKYLTQELCLSMIAHSRYTFVFVPDEFKTYDMCKFVMEDCPHLFVHVPDRFKTYDMCMFVVKKFGYALKYVPAEHRTQELCTAAVIHNKDALEYVPEHIQQHMCKNIKCV